MQEVWKDVVGFEKYFAVSRYGSVYSKRSGKILKQNTDSRGYKTVATKIGGRDGTNYCLKVHRMVAEAYLPQPSDELVARCANEHWGKVIVRHKDNDKANNAADNLEWGTSQDNTDDYWKTGEAAAKTLRGSKHGASKLSEIEVDEIRSLYKARSKDFGCRALARQFGISHPQISNIINVKSYK